MSTYVGSCHCEAVAFEFTAPVLAPFRCNCSFCVRRGATLQKVPSESFSLLRGDESLSRYGGRDFSKHFFCSRCGIQLFTRITRPNEESVVVSLACVPSIDLSTLTPREFDGANLL